MYLSWKELTTNDFTDSNINTLYDGGFLFTREHLGSMYQTRSLRIDLSKFELSSENKRILRKIEDLRLQIAELPYDKYDWTIGKLAKDFYETKFGLKTFSANKIKELLTTKHNFNKLLAYSLSLRGVSGANDAAIPINPPEIASSLTAPRNDNVGYAICRETNELLHYCYPFYDLKPKTQNLIPNIGMGMMLRAVLWAQDAGKKYIYLGSAQRPTDTYKLQFAGLEWFDGKIWQQNLDELKNTLK